MNNFTRHTCGILLATLFIWTGFQLATNIHYHKLPNGVVVAHSHPYKADTQKTPFASHHHSQTEFLLLQQLTIFLKVAPLVLLMMFAICIMLVFRLYRATFYNKLTFLTSFSFRAPPLSC